MIRLNLPDYAIKLSGSATRPQIFDTLRRKYVALTPEEWVRQHFVHYLTEHLGYPATLLANEVRLHVGDKVLRADTVLYDTTLRPRMIVEYKSPDVPVTERVFRQISAYNRLLQVDYLVVSNGLEHHCLKRNEGDDHFTPLLEIPRYEDL